VLSHFFRGKDDALLAGDKPDSCDQKFSGYDKRDKPDGKKARTEKSDKGDGDEEFVGKGIKEAAEIRFDFPAPCEVAVQPIGQCGGYKKS
jgi:hypothetical protein